MSNVVDVARQIVDAQRLVSGLSIVMDVQVRAAHVTDLPALGIAITQLQRERWRLTKYAREGDFFLARFERSWQIEGPAPGSRIPSDTAQTGLFPPVPPDGAGLPTHVHRFGEDGTCQEPWCGAVREAVPEAPQTAQEPPAPEAGADGPGTGKKRPRRGPRRKEGPS